MHVEGARQQYATRLLAYPWDGPWKVRLPSIKVGLTKHLALTHLCRSRQRSPRIRHSIFSDPGTHQANTYLGPALLDCLPIESARKRHGGDVPF